jgi:hypothetical protein
MGARGRTAEGPVALFEHAAGWLRRNRVLLPGVTVLARQVAAARKAAEARFYEALASAARRVDRRLPERPGEPPAGPGRVAGVGAGAAAPLAASQPRPEMVKVLQRNV